MVRMRLSRAIENDIKSDITVAKKMRLRWRSLLCVMIGALLIDGLFDHFGRLDLARPSMFSVAAIAFVIAVKRNLMRYAWFWITIALVVTLHAVLISSVTWTVNWVPAAVSAGICTVDLIIMLAILDSLEILLQRKEKTKMNSPPPE